MLGKGVLTPPTRDEAVGISDLTLAVKNPSERFIKGGFNGHDYSRYLNEDKKQGYVFSRQDCYWAMTNTLSSDVCYSLYGKRLQFGGFIPETPNGFVPIIPNDTPNTNRASEERWITDGDRILSVIMNGDEIPGDWQGQGKVTDELLSRTQLYRQQLPFVAEGIFLQVVKASQGTFRLYLVDSDYLQPTDKTIVVKAQLAACVTVTDFLTGKEIAVQKKSFAVTVKAGAYRILEARIK